MRTVLTGDGQLHLFRSLEEALGYIEWPEVQDRDTQIYTEDWKCFRLVAKRPENPARKIENPEIILEPVSDGEQAKSELMQYYMEFIENGCVDNFINSPASFFDDAEKRLGFT